MILYPAIDLKGGRCVRLVQGDMEQETVFNDDPVDQAARFVEDGFCWLHVVDLDGAVEGRSVNASAVSDILANSPIPVQVGGGVRTFETVEGWIEAGVSRVILGTAAVRDPDLVRLAAAAFPEQVAVSLDVRNRQVATRGWLEDSGLSALDVARRFEDAGVAALIVTDIGRDGMLSGVDAAVFGEVADAVSIPVIAAGGMTSIADIEALKRRQGAPIAGAVLGRSLYTGAIRADEALAAARA